MFEITKEISFEELLEKIEEAKNIGIFALIFGIFAVILVVILVCAYLDFDKLNTKRIDCLESLLEQEVEKNRALEYKFRIYCDRAVYLKSKDGKESQETEKNKFFDPNIGVFCDTAFYIPRDDAKKGNKK